MHLFGEHRGHENLKDEAFMPSLALKALSDGPVERLKYKGVSRTSRAVQAALQQYEEE